MRLTTQIVLSDCKCKAQRYITRPIYPEIRSEILTIFCPRESAGLPAARSGNGDSAVQFKTERTNKDCASILYCRKNAWKEAHRKF